MIDRIGNYHVTCEIGSGGMAVVYKGVQESLGRVVAIKSLKPEAIHNDNLIARFNREAQSIAALQHENIITVYDYFREQDSLYIVMEYVEGIDLFDLLDRCGKLPNDVAAIIAMQAARAMDYAHFRGIIHRDIKPANLIISKNGTVKLSDFGIARTEKSDLTETGIGLGTPSYMSPEQVVGDKLDHRSDMFSLGIVLYQMVTGQKPFIDDDKQTAMYKIRMISPPSPRSLNPEVSRDLERIIMRCLKKHPDDRFLSTQDLIVSLEQFLAQQSRMHYRVRLINFLREKQVLSLDETQTTLHPALIGDYSHTLSLVRLKRQVKRPWVMVLLFLLGLGIAASLFWGRRHKIQNQQIQECTEVLKQNPTGNLRVLVSPWAHIEIDGKQVATTPIEQPIKLVEGKHELKLSNPYFDTVEKTINIQANSTLEITEVLHSSAAGSRPVAPQDKP